jgi:hypothetical protein
MYNSAMEILKLGLVDVFNRVAHPLPDPKKEAEKFASSLKHISQKGAEEIIKIVVEEAGKSRKFGLFLNKDLLEREELFFLASVDYFGGLANMVKGHSFEEAGQIIAEVEHDFFENESSEFFAKFSKENDFGSKNRYDNHLESTRGAILNAVYNNQIQYQIR